MDKILKEFITDLDDIGQDDRFDTPAKWRNEFHRRHPRWRLIDFRSDEADEIFVWIYNRDKFTEEYHLHIDVNDDCRYQQIHLTPGLFLREL